MNNLVDLLDLFNFIDRADWLLAALKYRDLGRTVKIEHADKKKKGTPGTSMRLCSRSITLWYLVGELHQNT